MPQFSLAGRTRAVRGAPQSAANVFKRLFSVRIRHRYYNREHDLCPDFRICPTPDSARLMASLGLVFKDEGVGFSVFIDPAGVSRLLGYLRRTATTRDGTSGFWALLSFLLIPTNPTFVGITALPIDTDPMQVNLFACNNQAHPRRAEILLAKGTFLGADALYPTVQANLVLPVPTNTYYVVVTDLSGAQVQSKDLGPKGAPGGTVSLDIGDLSYGYYTIGLENVGGAPVAAPGYPLTVLYVPKQPMSLCLLDMLFTQPLPDMPGIYPVPPLFNLPPGEAPDQVGNIEYILPFDARATYWQYYIVPQAAGSTFTDLSIEGAGASFTRQKKPVLLPNGATAIVFKTTTSLPLRQRSSQRFQLRGSVRGENAQENAIVVTCLPVAPGAPVWPDRSSETGTSEMFIYV